MKFRDLLPFSLLDNSILDKLTTIAEVLIYTFLCRHEGSAYIDLRDVAHKFGVTEEEAMRALENIKKLHSNKKDI